MTKKCKLSYKTLYNHGFLITMMLFGSFMGMKSYLITSTITSLREKLDVEYDTLGWYFSFVSVGTISCLLLSGSIFDTYPYLIRWIMVAICVVSSICTMVMPWGGMLWLFVLIYFIGNIPLSSLNSGGQYHVLKIFKKNAVSKMQLYHNGFGIGSVLAGFIVHPFLPRKATSKMSMTHYCIELMKQQNISGQLPNISNTENHTNNFNVSIIFNSTYGFEYAYVVVGMFGCLFAFIFLLFQLLVRKPKYINYIPQIRQSWLRSINPRYLANGNVLYGTSMTILLFLYYCFYIHGVASIEGYITVLALDPCKGYSMGPKDAAVLLTASNVCFLIGRLVNSVLLKLNPTIILMALSYINICFCFVLVFFSEKYELALWIGFCGARFCCGPVYPSGTSYVNRYILVSSSLISLAFIGTSFASFTGTLLGGYLVERWPSVTITYSYFGGIIGMTAVLHIIILLGRYYGERSFEEIKINDHIERKQETC